MAGDFGIVYPLWNHIEGGGSLLERVIGEVGIDHVTIPVVTGPRALFRFFGPYETPYFRTEGGFHFPHSAKCYTASGIKPKAARWFAHRDELRKGGDVARAARVKVILRLDAGVTEALGAKAGEFVSRNAWGDAYDAGPPCISHPALREFVQATLTDL